MFLPTGASGDDLRPTLALARKLAKHGAEGRVVIVLSKIGRSDAQLQKAIEAIEGSGFELLAEHWPQRDGFQADLDVGRAGREARNPYLTRDGGEDGSGPVRARRRRQAALMAARSGSADLPLHGGRVPKWLGRADDQARRRHRRGRRAGIWPRRVSRPARASLLVPVLRRRDGDGLAFLGDHNLACSAP